VHPQVAHDAAIAEHIPRGCYDCGVYSSLNTEGAQLRVLRESDTILIWLEKRGEREGGSFLDV